MPASRYRIRHRRSIGSSGHPGGVGADGPWPAPPRAYTARMACSAAGSDSGLPSTARMSASYPGPVDDVRTCGPRRCWMSCSVGVRRFVPVVARRGSRSAAYSGPLKQLALRRVPRRLPRLDLASRRHPPAPPVVDQQDLHELHVEDPHLHRQGLHPPPTSTSQPPDRPVELGHRQRRIDNRGLDRTPFRLLLNVHPHKLRPRSDKTSRHTSRRSQDVTTSANTIGSRSNPALLPAPTRRTCPSGWASGPDSTAWAALDWGR